MSLKAANITNLSWQRFTAIICCVFFAFFVSACGGGGGGSGESSSEDSATETGAISFTVSQKDAAAYQSAAGAYIASSLDCSEISEVTAEVYDENGTLLISGGPWDCSARSGTIDNVPAGSNMTVVVIGKNSSGDEVYGGETINISVTLGQVTDAGTIETVPIDMTVEDLLDNGFSDFKDGAERLLAYDYFYRAKIKTRNSASNNADTARFFYAVTEVAAHQAYDIESDGEDDGLQDLGDIMDAFGAPESGRLPLFNVDYDFRDGTDEYYDDPFPDPLPSGSPTGADLQNFCFNIIRPELEAAIASLNLVSTSFNKTWLEPFDDETVESDYGDVLYVKAMLQGALASIYIQRAYNLNVDIYEEDQSDKTDEQFIDDNPNIGALGSSYDSYLSTAKQLSLDSLTNLEDTIDWIQDETDSQSDDWVNLVDEVSSDIDEAKLDIADAKNSMNGPTTVRDNDVDDPDDPDDDPFTLDLSVFYAGVDFRTPNLLPPVTGDYVSGLFPDPTIKGIFGSDLDLNEDNYPQPESDGIPDIFDDDNPPELLTNQCVPESGATYDVNANDRVIKLVFSEPMREGWSFNHDLGSLTSWWENDSNHKRRYFYIKADTDLSPGEHTITLNPGGHGYWFQDEHGNSLAPDTVYTFTQE